MANTEKNVLIYCRESRDDGYSNYERIETQRDILVAYCEKHALGKITDIVMDDNKSGTDFKRLEPVKELVEKGRIHIFLCKDASRIGRNITESLLFIDFLHSHHVKPVFESESYDEDIFPIIAWFNERRAKDDSGKIRRVLRHKMETGELLIAAPYGYKKEGKSLLIDNTAAEVVSRVFRCFIEGMPKREIAELFNQEGIPTPSLYKNLPRAVKHWNKQHIDRILKNIAYTGDMPYSMREKASYKSKKYIRKAQEDWVISKNHHEAIVPAEVYEKALSILAQNKKHAPRKIRTSIFSGILFCGLCGNSMYRKNQQGRQACYVCGKYVRNGREEGCTSHWIPEKLLISHVQKHITHILERPAIRKKLIELAKQGNEYSDDWEDRLQKGLGRIAQLKKKALLVYEDKLNDILPAFVFAEKMKELEKEIREAENDCALARELISTASREGGNPYMIDHEEVKKIASSYAVRYFVEKIIVLEPDDITKISPAHFGLEEKGHALLQKEGGVLMILVDWPELALDRD